VLLALARPAEAAVAFREAAALAPGDADAWYGLGNALLAAGSAREAAEAFERATGLDPLEGRFLGSLGVALFECGEEKAAVARLRRAVEIAPGLDVAWYHLARALGTARDAAVRRPDEALAIARRLAAAHAGEPAFEALPGIVAGGAKPRR
jgi:tetratricopeptide (TPR) repeat protein